MAIKYVNYSIGTGPRYGKGHGPINHLCTININTKYGSFKYLNGKKLHVSYVNGQKDGLWVEWHENGEKKSEGFYKKIKRKIVGPIGMMMAIKNQKALMKMGNLMVNGQSGMSGSGGMRLNILL